MMWSQIVTDCSDLVPGERVAGGAKFRLVVVGLDDFDLIDISQVLAPSEEEQYQRYRFPKRQKEWLCGRLACKEAVARLVGLDSLVDIFVANDNHGRPLVTGRGVGGVYVSISHSGGLAMAMACFKPCGLDLQEITPTLAKVEDKFIRVTEQDVLSDFNGSTLEQQGLVWASKEALRKLLPLWPLLGFLEAQIESVATTEGGFMVHCSPCEEKRSLPPMPVVYATLYTQYALALCFALEATDEKERKDGNIETDW